MNQEREEKVLADLVAEGVITLVALPKKEKIMKTRDVIAGALNAGSPEEQEAMLKVCEESLVEYALADLSELLDLFREIDINKLSDAAKKRFTYVAQKIKAMILIGKSSHKNIDISEIRDIRYQDGNLNAGAASVVIKLSSESPKLDIGPDDLKSSEQPLWC
jgi:hypothetical protein